MAASVQARLDSLRNRKGLELELVLSEYAIERLLYRLGISPYAERFVLKGATLFRLWSDQRGRATWDLDLLGRDEGDAVVPPPRRTRFPVLLDLAAPEILVYPKETVVAEKFSAKVTKGVTNTRMKDFYDVDLLARTQEFRGSLLVQSLRAPAWKAFLRRGRLDAGPDAEGLHGRVRGFLLPVWQAASQGLPFIFTWTPGGPWRPGEKIGES